MLFLCVVIFVCICESGCFEGWWILEVYFEVYCEEVVVVDWVVVVVEEVGVVDVGGIGVLVVGIEVDVDGFGVFVEVWFVVFDVV